MKVHGIAQGVWPQGKVDPLGPAGMRVEQLLACALQEVLDGLLGNAVLEVGVHATKGELLSSVMACLSEGIVMKSPIVTVVVEDLTPCSAKYCFKASLAKCFGRQIVTLEVDEAEMAVVVNKDGGALIALFGKSAFQLRIETHFS